MISNKYKKGLPSILISIPWELNIKGGVNTVVQGLIEEYNLPTSAYNVVLHVNNWQPPNAEDFEFPYTIIRIPTTTLSCCPSFFDKCKFLLYRLPKMHCQWFWTIRKYKIRCVNVHYPVRSTLAFLSLCKLNKVKSIFSFHGTDIDQLHKLLSRKKIKELTEKTDKFVVSSLSSKVRLVSKNKGYIDKVEVVPNGVNSAKIYNSIQYNAGVKALNFSYFINIATYESQKGQAIIVQAFKLLLEHNPQVQQKLVLVGRATPYLDDLKALVNELRLNDKVIFYADLEHSDTMALLSRADLLLLPSWKEAFGLVLIEAGILNIPVMAHSVGGVREVVSKEDGILVAQNTQEQWYQYLQAFVDGEFNLIKLKQSFKNKIVQQYSNSTLARSYIDLLDDLGC